MREVSIVVPVYNEEGNVRELHKEINGVCIREGYKYEIIFIDDGSKDKTPVICKELKPLKYIRLRKNFGQTAAMDAGIKASIYDKIITMDGDRQNDPNDIPKLIEHLESNGFDIVSGWRKKRKDTFFKKFTSRGANLLRGILIKDGIHDSGCSLKIYKKECFDHLSLYGEMHRFIPALLKIKGFTVGEVEVNHRPRTAGKTKYNWKRSVKGFVDMISVWFWNKYAVRPLHLLGGGGLILMMMGGLTGAYTVYLFIKGVSLSDSAWPILTAFLGLAGIQMFVSGLIADMLSKNYYELTRDRSYSIQEIIDNS